MKPPEVREFAAVPAEVAARFIEGSLGKHLALQPPPQGKLTLLAITHPADRSRAAQRPRALQLRPASSTATMIAETDKMKVISPQIMILLFTSLLRISLP